MKSILIPLLLSTMIGHSQAQTCVATASMTVTINDNCSKLAPKAFLQGPYNATLGMMNDHLRTASLIPTTSPQDAATTAPASVVNNPTNTLLNTNPDAIVDWVLVELRDKTNPATIKGSAAALVQRDGDIVAVDGVSPVVVNVPALTSGYYVAVKHRNHLGVMTGTAMPMLAGATAVVDFTTMGNGATAAMGSVGQTWGKDAQADLTGEKFGMWSGNVNPDIPVNLLKYGNVNNDRAVILIKLGGNISGVLSGYYAAEDVNMDTIIRYGNVNNDRALILLNVGGNISGTRLEQLPTP